MCIKQFSNLVKDICACLFYVNRKRINLQIYLGKINFGNAKRLLYIKLSLIVEREQIYELIEVKN